jgi:hypothetical protein
MPLSVAQPEKGTPSVGRDGSIADSVKGSLRSLGALDGIGCVLMWATDGDGHSERRTDENRA